MRGQVLQRAPVSTVARLRPTATARTAGPRPAFSFDHRAITGGGDAAQLQSPQRWQELLRPPRSLHPSRLLHPVPAQTRGRTDSTASLHDSTANLRPAGGVIRFNCMSTAGARHEQPPAASICASAGTRGTATANSCSTRCGRSATRARTKPLATSCLPGDKATSTSKARRTTCRSPYRHRPCSRTRPSARSPPTTPRRC